MWKVEVEALEQHLRRADRSLRAADDIESARCSRNVSRSSASAYAHNPIREPSASMNAHAAAVFCSTALSGILPRAFSLSCRYSCGLKNAMCARVDTSSSSCGCCCCCCACCATVGSDADGPADGRRFAAPLAPAVADMLSTIGAVMRTCTDGRHASPELLQSATRLVATPRPSSMIVAPHPTAGKRCTVCKSMWRFPAGGAGACANRRPDARAAPLGSSWIPSWPNLVDVFFSSYLPRGLPCAQAYGGGTGRSWHCTPDPLLRFRYRLHLAAAVLWVAAPSNLFKWFCSFREQDLLPHTSYLSLPLRTGGRFSVPIMGSSWRFVPCLPSSALLRHEAVGNVCNGEALEHEKKTRSLYIMRANN